jgi:hypothetical protein
VVEEIVSVFHKDKAAKWYQLKKKWEKMKKKFIL